MAHVVFDVTQPTLTVDQLRQAVMQAKDGDVHGVCVLPGWVRTAKIMVARSSVRVWTLIGYPTGGHTASVKALETRLALQDGADHVIMTPNVGYFLGGQLDEVTKEVAYVAKAVREVAPEQARSLAVLINLGLLPDAQVASFVEFVLQAGGHGLHLKTLPLMTADRVAGLVRRFTTRSTTMLLSVQLASDRPAADLGDWQREGIDALLIEPPMLTG